MALSPDELATTRRYLGFAETSRDLDTWLETRLTSLPAASLTLVRADLARLAQVDDKLQNAALRNLNFVSGDGAVFLGPAQIATLQDYGRSLIQRIAIAVQVECPRDYFGAGAAGGVIPLG